MHCKSGADRAGFAAALYLMLQKRRSAEEAQEQLSWRFLHLRGARDRGAALPARALRRRHRRETPMSFRDWVETRYDPEALMAEYRSGAGGGLPGRPGAAPGVSGP